ncbi:hypothetical protein ACF09H_22175 [Streptomyces sp. NPDC014983]|uniref:hypothetical protein n=1 Tax=Streptomyces sp. NPDC014983 TaxID=3364933 RepID=UPI0036F9321D
MSAQQAVSVQEFEHAAANAGYTAQPADDSQPLGRPRFVLRPYREPDPEISTVELVAAGGYVEAAVITERLYNRPQRVEDRVSPQEALAYMAHTARHLRWRSA